MNDLILIFPKFSKIYKKGEKLLKTKNGVELNLKESDYYFEFARAVFYFSSEFNLNRFNIY